MSAAPGRPLPLITPENEFFWTSGADGTLRLQQCQTYSAFNRHEPLAADWVTIDHRRIVAIGANDLPATIRAIWDLTPDVSIHVEAVHRLSSLGAVVTSAMRGTSPEGFDAEWRMLQLLTVEGDRIARCELFDEADLDAALARFEELQTPPTRLENTASVVDQKFWACIATRDWGAIAQLVSDDIYIDDRRKTVNAGVRHGRDDYIADLETIAEFSQRTTSTVVAARGTRLALTTIRTANRNLGFAAELFCVVEIDEDDRMVARIGFDIDEIDAAFAELDARYVAGEAAAHSHTWSVIANACTAFNRREMFPTTPNWLNIDHRPTVGFAPGDMTAYIGATWDVAPDAKNRIEVVHRLSDIGAVITHRTKGTSKDGVVAEWRAIGLLTVEGDSISRVEVFDESDLDAALAGFDELNRTLPLENAATRAWARVTDAFNRRDLDGVLAVSSPDAGYEDRRKGLGDVVTGPAKPKAVLAAFEMAPSSWRMEVEPIAIRGARFALARGCYRDVDAADRPIAVEFLNVLEVGDDGLAHHTVTFDPDDINGAFAELTARWIASGEVEHPEIIETMCRLNEIATRHDWDTYAALSAGAAFVSHRRLSSPDIQTIADHMSSNRAMASLVADYRVELAEVLAHSAKGAVNHLVVKGTSSDGLSIEIPFVAITLVEGNRVTRLEGFDPDQRDLALARFDELNVESHPQ